VARIVAQWLRESLRQPFVVENRPGAAGNIAAQAVISSQADGYRLLVVTTASVINATPAYVQLPERCCARCESGVDGKPRRNAPVGPSEHARLIHCTCHREIRVKGSPALPSSCGRRSDSAGIL